MISIRHAIGLIALVGSLSTAAAEEFRIEEAGPPQGWTLAQLKPGAVLFNDAARGGTASESDNFVAFAPWAQANPLQKKFLALFPSYVEPTVNKAASADTPAGPVLQKLAMYVAQARF